VASRGWSRRLVGGGVGRRDVIDDPRCPAEFGLAIAFVVELASTALLVGLRSDVDVASATAAVVATVVVLAWWTRPAAAMASAALGWLFLTTFMVDKSETLRWHGSADLIRLLELVGVAVVVTTLRSVQLALRRRYSTVPTDWPVDSWFDDEDCGATVHVWELGK
jgi:K+-sensing histidine kinase KdpD